MDEVRASDAEREATVRRLHAAATAGRLDADELEERIAGAYRARTRAELVPLTRDLPKERPKTVARRPASHPSVLRQRAAGAVGASVVACAVWLVTGAGDSFWPKWVIVLGALSVIRPLVRRASGRGADSRRRSR